MYQVYEKLLGYLHFRQSFNSQSEAVSFADKLKKDWKTYGQSRHYRVSYQSQLVYEN